MYVRVCDGREEARVYKFEREGDRMRAKFTMDKKGSQIQMTWITVISYTHQPF